MIEEHDKHTPVKTGRKNTTSPVQYRICFDVYNQAPDGNKVKRGTMELHSDSFTYYKKGAHKPTKRGRMTTLIDIVEGLK